MPINEFQAPIPGQSLTDAPGSRPWERPPEITDPEEAIQMYLIKLSDPEVTQDLMDLLELDTDIRTLTEGILRGGVSSGVHSIDVSLIVAPVIHEYIKQSAEAAGVEYEEGLEDKEFKKQKERELSKAKSLKWAKQQIEKSGVKPPEAPKEETSVEMSTEEPKGFMKRRGDL